VRVQWQTLFLITSAFYVFSTTFYVLCGSGKLQWWALDSSSQQVPVRTDGLAPSLRSDDVSNRPRQPVNRHFSSPSRVYASKPGAGASEAPYSRDSLRRAADLATEAARGGAPNHLSPSGDDSDALDRKLSSKSTSSSKTRDDVAAPAPVAAAAPTRRTDHDREHQPRTRRDQSSSTKRQSKLSQSKPATTPPASATTTTPPVLPASPDEGLRIYESLSESPV